MLPNVRLLIAAMLASVLVLICGFGVFAAFRVSRDPIAHLPVAAPPSQLLAETSRLIAVGTLITECPPHRSERARFGHSAPTSGA